MNTKRYQLYLNPNSVSILDEYSEQTDISRSQLIQMAIDQVAQNLRKVFVSTKTPVKNSYLLDSLIGAIKLEGNKQTNFASNIDKIYLHD